MWGYAVPVMWSVLLVWSLWCVVTGWGFPWAAWVSGTASVANIFLWRETRLRAAHRSTQENLRSALEKTAHTGLPGYDEAGNRVPDVTAMKQVAWCRQPGLHEAHNFNYQLSSARGQFGETVLVNHYDRCPGHPDQFSGIGEVEAFLQEG